MAIGPLVSQQGAVPGPSPKAGLSLLVVCTGNAARSVMVGAMLEALWEDPVRPLQVTTAGTHALEDQPMGMRTRKALASVGPLARFSPGAHRSRQVRSGDVAGADLVVAMEADHVRWLRRHHPASAPRAATLRRLVQELVPGPAPLAERVAALGLAGVELTGDEDVADPAGADEETYAACAQELWALTVELVGRL